MARSPNIVTANGNAKISTAQFKFGTASAIFDGAGDYLSIPNTAGIFNFGTGNFTVEGWFRFDRTDTDVCLFGGAAQTGSFDFRRTADNTIRVGRTNTAWDVISSGFATVTNTWTHIAVSRSGTTIKIFVNGAQRASVTNSVNYQITGDAFIGGHPTETYLAGYIDELRVSNTARYTAAFTPSTTRFVGDDNTRLLLHMDGANNSTVFPDDTGTAQQAAAVINATATLTAAPRRNRPGAAQVISTSTLTATPQRIRGSATNILSTSTVTATAGRIVDAVIDIESLFSPGMTVTVLKNSFAVLEVTSDLTNTISKIAGNQSLLEALIDLQLQGARTRDLTSVMMAESAATVTAINIKTLAAEFNSIANVICSVDKVLEATVAIASDAELQASGTVDYAASAELISTATLTASVDIAVPNKEYIDIGYIDPDYFESVAPAIVTITANLLSEFTTEAIAYRTAGLVADLDSEFATAATGASILQSAAELNTTSDLTITANQIKATAATLLAQSTLTASIKEISEIEIILIANTALTASIGKIIGGIATLTSNSNLTSTATVINSGAADILSTTTLTTQASNILSATISILSAMTGVVNVKLSKAGTADLIATSTLTANATANKPASVSLQSSSNMAISADKVSIIRANLQVVINMLADTRGLGIAPERTYKVPFENRTYGILNENRIYRIPSETRTWKVT